LKDGNIEIAVGVVLGPRRSAIVQVIIRQIDARPIGAGNRQSFAALLAVGCMVANLADGVVGDNFTKKSCLKIALVECGRGSAAASLREWIERGANLEPDVDPRRRQYVGVERPQNRD